MEIVRGGGEEIRQAGALRQNGLKHPAIRLTSILNWEAQRVNPSRCDDQVIGCRTSAIARNASVLARVGRQHERFRPGLHVCRRDASG